ncbi:hypothetical protein CRUP_014060 [Coryphaenoides rupestris]|nr:hypothetical protein CRUP_014060 [Coryphaenoides rupestris]
MLTPKPICPDGNQCQSHRCVNGSCVDLYGAYACQSRVATDCSVDNGGCHHGCTESEDGLARTCTCVPGYRLHEDGKSCKATGTSSCGQLLISRSSYSAPIQGLQPWMLGGEVGKKGESPWQALLLNNRGEFHCGGVLIDRSWVLTAAHCLGRSLRFQTMDNDIALLRLDSPAPISTYILPACLPPRALAERVLHLNGTGTVVTGWAATRPTPATSVRH